MFTPRPLGPLADIAAETGGDLEELVETGARPHQVLRALLEELRGSRPALLVFEDVHWADEATLDVLRLLARRVATVPTLVLATWRDDELDRAHPLRILVGELASAPAVSRVSLPPLTIEAVRTLSAPHPVDADELHRVTGGNPFFVTEVLTAEGAALPESVRDAVLARVSRLTTAARRLVDAVALVPPRVEPWLLEEIGGRTSWRSMPASPRGCCAPSRGESRSGTSSRGAPSKMQFRRLVGSPSTAQSCEV
ncbi:MAG: AAA family ATPase [Gaiellaceae bacterium MAG52_C11]|nr:AAA family ATPase [Candidatus Gaiellasilicea maunaloa]